MKSFIVFALLVAAAVAIPVDPKETVVRFEVTNDGDGRYEYGYATSNGISGQERGELRNVGTENEGIAVQGEYSYTGPDGVVYHVVFEADELGFRPKGAHLPQV